MDDYRNSPEYVRQRLIELEQLVAEAPGEIRDAEREYKNAHHTRSVAQAKKQLEIADSAELKKKYSNQDQRNALVLVDTEALVMGENMAEVELNYHKNSSKARSVEADLIRTRAADIRTEMRL